MLPTAAQQNSVHRKILDETLKPIIKEYLVQWLFYFRSDEHIAIAQYLDSMLQGKPNYFQFHQIIYCLRHIVANSEKGSRLRNLVQGSYHKLLNALVHNRELCEYIFRESKAAKPQTIELKHGWIFTTFCKIPTNPTLLKFNEFPVATTSRIKRAICNELILILQNAREDYKTVDSSQLVLLNYFVKEARSSCSRSDDYISENVRYQLENLYHSILSFLLTNFAHVRKILATEAKLCLLSQEEKVTFDINLPDSSAKSYLTLVLDNFIAGKIKPECICACLNEPKIQNKVNMAAVIDRINNLALEQTTHATCADLFNCLISMIDQSNNFDHAKNYLEQLIKSLSPILVDATWMRFATIARRYNVPHTLPPFISTSEITNRKKLLTDSRSSDIYTAQLNSTQQKIVLKKIKVGTENKEEYLIRECKLLFDLRHPNIVVCLGFTKPFQMIMEKLEYNLWFYIINIANKTVDEEILYRFVCNILAALSFMHSKIIAHLDVKPANVLVGYDEQNQLICKLTDVGLFKNNFPLNPGEITRATTHFVMSPEQFKPETTPTEFLDVSKCDMFAFGILLHMLMSGEWPYELLPDSPDFFSPKGFAALFDEVVTKQHRPYYDFSNDQRNIAPLINLRNRCWSHNANDRLAAEPALKVVETARGLRC